MTDSSYGDARIFRPKILQHAFRLKIIGNATPYLNNIDVAQARAQGIEVVNAPDANSRCRRRTYLVAAVGLARGLLWRGTGLTRRAVWAWDYAAKRWASSVSAVGGKSPFAPGVRHESHRQSTRPDAGIGSWKPASRGVDLADLLAAADFVNLHVPLWPTTRGLIGSAELAAMKPAPT